MNLDKDSLPVQDNGDANDQLQRVGMIDIGTGIYTEQIWEFQAPIPHEVQVAAVYALSDWLQPSPGVYIRHRNGDPLNVSADQLIPAIGAHVVAKDTKEVRNAFIQMMKRLGFAQNIRDGLNASTNYKIPDFMFLRAMPIFTRISPWLYPLTLIFDLYLVVMAISAVLDRNPDHVDDNNIIITLAIAAKFSPTPISYLARRLYSKFRADNYGSYSGRNKVEGALMWYHRREAGGNPAIAELWAPICRKYFGG